MRSKDRRNPYGREGYYRIMSIVELKDEKSIATTIKECWHDNDDSIMPPLFHGTDASLIGISQTERECLNKACEIVIHSLCKLFVDNSVSITDKRLINSKDDHGNSANAYVYAQARINKSALYSYDDFYVTNNPSRAVDYSKHAYIYGETGWIANRLVIGAGEIGIDLPQDDDFLNAIEVINQKKIMERKPIILMVANIHTSDCFRENGVAIGADFEEISFWMKALKHRTITQSFRIKKQCELNDLSLYIIQEDDFAKMINLWSA